jgi:hypothetical protein
MSAADMSVLGIAISATDFFADVDALTIVAIAAAAGALRSQVPG